MNVKKTALYNLHKKHGAKFVNFAGYEMPIQYKSGIITEHNMTRNKSGIFDVSHMGQLFIKDKDDLTENLQKIFPTDLKKLSINQSKYSFLMKENGGIYDDLIITKIEDGYMIILNAACKKNDLLIIKSKLDNKFELILRDDLSLVAIQGPESKDILEKIIPGVKKIKFMNGNKFSFNSEEIYITRSGYTGEDGFEIIGEKEKISQVISILLKDKKLKLIGLGARDSLRLEAGLCLYGNELTEKINPMEAGISWVIDKKNMELEKFYGSVSFKNILKTGIKKKRCGFVLSDRHIARSGTLISNNKREIRGYITSGCFSPTLNKSICMGFINTNCKEKENLYVNIRSNFIKINKINLPFVQHKYKNK